MSSPSNGCGRSSTPAASREINELHIPVSRPIRLVMASQDVIHSFFIPALRLKHDVVPGRYQDLEITADKPGALSSVLRGILRHRAFRHDRRDRGDGSRRLCRLARAAGRHPARWRRRAARCFASSAAAAVTAGGSKVHAPPLEGLYGNPVPLADGSFVTADDKYIRDSILLPRSQIAAGYEPLMPSFEGKVSEDQLLRLVAYIKSIGGQQP